jgi:hypothetical protein
MEYPRTKVVWGNRKGERKMDEKLEVAVLRSVPSVGGGFLAPGYWVGWPGTRDGATPCGVLQKGTGEEGGWGRPPLMMEERSERLGEGYTRGVRVWLVRVGTLIHWLEELGLEEVIAPSLWDRDPRMVLVWDKYEWGW